MGRAKQRMELISNGKSRYVTFQKRKKGMKKKAYELQTLCDVEVCLIVYGPTTDSEHDHNRYSDAEIWPENPHTIHRLIESYKNQPPEDRLKRTQTLSNFFMDRNQKIEDSLVKLRKKNDEATYSTWDDRYNDLSMEQLRMLEVTLEGKLQDVNVRIALMKKATSQNPPPCLEHGGDIFGMQWEEVYEQQQQLQQPLSMLNPWHDQFNASFHYPVDHEFQQQGIQIFDHANNFMANPGVITTPRNIYGNHYSSGIQLGGSSSSKFMCNLVPLPSPIYGYNPLTLPMPGTYDPLPIGYHNPNLETMTMAGSDSSYHMDKYFKPSKFQASNQN